MKIYTKTGDKGKTSLFGKARVEKDDIRIEAYGTVDELNSQIGMLISLIDNGELKSQLVIIQSKLFDLGSNLAADPDGNFDLPKVSAQNSNQLEEWIDQMNTKLDPLKSFILPSGSRACASAHICRTICRRAERRTVSLAKTADVDPNIIVYLNRLSDYFFVAARFLLKLDGVEEIPWIAD